MSKMYEIIVFTASQKMYADKIIDQIDPKRRISHRLYREHCIVLNKSSYLKNLNLLGRNLKETIIVDVFSSLFRIIISLESFNHKISIEYNLLKETKKTGIFVDCLLSSNIFIKRLRYSQSKIKGRYFNKWKSKSNKRSSVKPDHLIVLKHGLLINVRGNIGTKRPTVKSSPWFPITLKPTPKHKQQLLS